MQCIKFLLAFYKQGCGRMCVSPEPSIVFSKLFLNKDLRAGSVLSEILFTLSIWVSFS